MGQPTVVRIGDRTVAKFGNAALPNGQGVLANIDLNDQIHTVLVNQFTSDDGNRQLGLAQLLYRGRSVFTSDDFGPRAIHLPMLYIEDSTHFLGGFLAALSQAGEQQLTFDNATYILAKYAGATNRLPARPSLGRGGIPLAWEFTLELIAKSPWFQDAAATTMAPLTLTVDAGQSFNITYAGSVWAEPIWTFHVPATNAVAINSLQLKNTMSGEFLTVNFQSVAALPASTLADISIDCALMTATNITNGNVYDVSGSFPMLYPPAGQVNAFSVILSPASGSTAGCTIACSHFPRWQI